MIGRGKTLILAGVLALLPVVAQAQSSGLGATTAEQPAGTAPRVEVPVPAQPAPSTPAELSEQARSEAATTPAPENPTPGLSVPDQAGGGSLSEGLAAAGDAPVTPRLAPDPEYGQPDGDWTLQEQVTPIGLEASFFSDYILLPLMAVVTLFVFVLLIYAIFAFRARDGRVPSKTSHNTFIEVIWTVTPVLILIGIAVPSFRLLANQYDPPPADLTIKATGHQWYWSYEYPDNGVEFDSIMMPEDETAAQGLPRLLETDNRVVVPAGATVKMLVTSADVIHSWAIPSFWVKMDAVPGRVNETWFKVDRPGVYYGQCSELCGTRHGFMPIAVEVLPPDQFRAWVLAQGGSFPSAAAPSAAETTPATASPGATPATPAPAAGEPVAPEPTPL